MSRSIRFESLVALVLTLLAAGVCSLGEVVLAPALSLVFVAWFTLAHAASAASERIRPGGRGRLILCAILFVGAVGAVLTVGARLHERLVLRGLALLS